MVFKLVDGLLLAWSIVFVGLPMALFGALFAFQTFAGIGIYDPSVGGDPSIALWFESRHNPVPLIGALCLRLISAAALARSGRENAATTGSLLVLSAVGLQCMGSVALPYTTAHFGTGVGMFPALALPGSLILILAAIPAVRRLLSRSAKD